MVKILLIILAAGALITGGVLFRDYAVQSAATETIAAQMENDSEALEKVSNLTQRSNTEIAAIGVSIEDINEAIAAENLVIPARINSNEIVRSILTQGEDAELQVIPLSTQDWTNAKIGKHDYSVFRMSVSIIGNQHSLMDFVKKLGELYRTLAIESLSVSKPPEITEEGTVEAEMRLAVYALQ